jgi:hypothetical protein
MLNGTTTNFENAGVLWELEMSSYSCFSLKMPLDN